MDVYLIDPSKPLSEDSPSYTTTDKVMAITGVDLYALAKGKLFALLLDKKSKKKNHLLLFVMWIKESKKNPSFVIYNINKVVENLSIKRVMPIWRILRGKLPILTLENIQGKMGDLILNQVYFVLVVMKEFFFNR